MKLRNKKTGEIQVLRFPHNEFDEDDKQYSLNLLDYKGNEYIYNSLAELNEEWEDAPAEPLIKDEKVRKVVQAWAKVNSFNKVKHLHSEGMSGFYYEDIDGNDFLLDFIFPIAGLPVNETYTIAELCGEEEE